MYNNNYNIAMIKWLDSYPCNWKYFPTLTFTDSFGNLDRYDIREIVEREFRHFASRLNNEIYGKRSKRFIEMLPILEFTNSGIPHYHVPPMSG